MGENEEVIQTLTSLNLPWMPTLSEIQSDKEPPTFRILVVADIDLESASALAESALATFPKKTLSSIDANADNSQTACSRSGNPLHEVDLCIACGSFTREDDL